MARNLCPSRFVAYTRDGQSVLHVRNKCVAGESIRRIIQWEIHVSVRNVKAFVFDVFGTVVDWRGGVAREAAPFLQRHGATGAAPEAFADAWRIRYVPAMRKIIGGERSFVRLDVLHRENLVD